MSTRTRIVVVLAALAAVALPAARLAGSRSPPPPAPPAAAAASAVQGAPAAAVPAERPAPATVAAPPLPRRAAALKTTPTRALARPVRPGEAPDGPAPRIAPLVPAPPPSAWADVEIVNPWGAGSPSPALTKAIEATLRPRLAACFERLAQAGWAGLGRSYSVVSPPGEAGPGPAILVLEVERDGAGAKVVDAPVETRGSASDGTLNCAQAMLRGGTRCGAERGLAPRDHSGVASRPLVSLFARGCAGAGRLSRVA